MQPAVGPVRFRVRGVEAPIFTGSVLGPVEFRWPRALFVTSLLLLPKSGARPDLAQLSIEIEDETQQQIVSSGNGQNQAAAALALNGQTPIGPMLTDLVLARPFAIQRPVNTGDKWYITIRNAAGGIALTVTPELYFDFEDGHQ